MVLGAQLSSVISIVTMLTFSKYRQIISGNYCVSPQMSAGLNIFHLYLDYHLGGDIITALFFYDCRDHSYAPHGSFSLWELFLMVAKVIRCRILIFSLGGTLNNRLLKFK